MNWEPKEDRLDTLARMEQDTLENRDAIITKLAENEAKLQRIRQERKELES